jgi:adenine-specific DNA-methyltransferase
MELTREFPSVVKYMGSKTDVLELIENGINFLNKDYEYICDLFAGSATLSGALRGKANVISNDIQSYSAIFSETYLNNYKWDHYPEIEKICNDAEKRVIEFNSFFKEYAGKFSYDREFSLDELNELEEEQRQLINIKNWDKFDNYYLFVQNYSGTYWSYDQCVWIDSFRYVADTYKSRKELYNLLLTTLIYAMAYNSQSTGHYAQYRVPDTDSSMEDILIYRRKTIKDFFVRKYEELKIFLSVNNPYRVQTMSLTDTACLSQIPERTLVYADPPYCFVHYSRFYHIIETLVRYDYPSVKYKGRYRDDRYQSEFCKKTEVTDAFVNMFKLIKQNKVDLILSYSNSETNTIGLDILMQLCCKTFDEHVCNDLLIQDVLEKMNAFLNDSDKECEILLDKDDFNNSLSYEISIMKKPYNHSRMGRKEIKTIAVTEVLLIAKYVMK